VRNEQTHQSYLSEHVSVFDAWRIAQAPPQMPGAPHFLSPQNMANAKSGLAMIYSELQRQAAMLALNDIYWTLFWLSTLLTPVLLLSWLWANNRLDRTATASSDAVAMAH
jgi:hypothetical protein